MDFAQVYINTLRLVTLLGFPLALISWPLAYLLFQPEPPIVRPPAIVQIETVIENGKEKTKTTTVVCGANNPSMISSATEFALNTADKLLSWPQSKELASARLVDLVKTISERPAAKGPFDRQTSLLLKASESSSASFQVTRQDVHYDTTARVYTALIEGVQTVTQGEVQTSSEKKLEMILSLNSAEERNRDVYSLFRISKLVIPEAKKN